MKSNNNSTLLPDNQSHVIAALHIQANGFIGQKTVELLCNISASEIYRRQKAGTFPNREHIGLGQRKAYRIKDIIAWLDNPLNWKVAGAVERT